jgi:hypothetical protein
MGRDFIKSIGRIQKYKIKKFYCGKWEKYRKLHNK